MASDIFSVRSANIFTNSSMDLIDDAIYWLKRDSQSRIVMEKQLDPYTYAKEFRTLRISGRRQLGHTHLINQLSYDISSPIGSKYSTLIVAPNSDMAQHYYGARSAQYEPLENFESMREYSNEYANRLRNMRKLGDFLHGKAVTINQITSHSLHAQKFALANKRAITEITDKEISDRTRIDILCIDCTSMYSKEQIDHIYDRFQDEVELFLFLS